jgi:hypothetical protein
VYCGTIPTPRIDKLASEGIHFNNYNVEAQCTPDALGDHDRAAWVRSGFGPTRILEKNGRTNHRIVHFVICLFIVHSRSLVVF